MYQAEGAERHDALGTSTAARAWPLRHPLAVLLPVQAVLLLTDLGRLPIWGDEQASLARAALPVGELGAALSNNVHPTLYFAVLHAWLAALRPAPAIVAARALSALVVLAATVAIDRCWLRGLDRRDRARFLVLWTLSPALLLYGRMARSYSLQLLLAGLALAAAVQYARRPSRWPWLAYVLTATALLYTHYLAGIAVVAGASLAMLGRAVRQRDRALAGGLALAVVAIALGFAPALWNFAHAFALVATAKPYHLLGRALDAGAALAFMAVSFSIGEAVWPWMIVSLAVLAPVVAILFAGGLRQSPPWLAAVAPAAVIGFVAAGQWVSYAFVAGRLLFLLPFYLLLLVHGGRAHPRLGALAYAGLVILSVGGISAYFAQSGFLNKAYVIPADAIAGTIRERSAGAPITVVLDHHSTNLAAVAAALPPEATTALLVDAGGVATAQDIATRADANLVWFVHSTHDTSLEHWNRQVEDAFARGYAVRRIGFAPYSAVDRTLMRLAGWPEQPAYAIEVDEFRAQASR